jgi:hypothetical protein
MIQFLVPVRTLVEVLRLEHVPTAAPSGRTIDLYVIGALAAAIGCWITVIAFIAQRTRASVLAAALTIGLLFTYKVLYLC